MEPLLRRVAARDDIKTGAADVGRLDEVEEEGEVGRRREGAVEGEADILIGGRLDDDRRARREELSIDDVVAVATSGQQDFKLLDRLGARLEIGAVLGHVVAVFVAAVDRSTRARVGPDVVSAVGEALLSADVETMLQLECGDARLVNDGLPRAQQVRALV